MCSCLQAPPSGWPAAAAAAAAAAPAAAAQSKRKAPAAGAATTRARAVWVVVVAAATAGSGARPIQEWQQQQQQQQQQHPRRWRVQERVSTQALAAGDSRLHKPRQRCPPCHKVQQQLPCRLQAGSSHLRLSLLPRRSLRVGRVAGLRECPRPRPDPQKKLRTLQQVTRHCSVPCSSIHGRHSLSAQQQK